MYICPQSEKADVARLERERSEFILRITEAEEGDKLLAAELATLSFCLPACRPRSCPQRSVILRTRRRSQVGAGYQESIWLAKEVFQTGEGTQLAQNDALSALKKLNAETAALHALEKKKAERLKPACSAEKQLASDVEHSSSSYPSHPQPKRAIPDPTNHQPPAKKSHSFEVIEVDT
eukprot:g45200.t1